MSIVAALPLSNPTHQRAFSMGAALDVRNLGQRRITSRQRAASTFEAYALRPVAGATGIGGRIP